MGGDEFVNKAFEKAAQDLDNTLARAEVIGHYFEVNFEEIMNTWQRVAPPAGDDFIRWVVLQGYEGEVESLARVFFIAGWETHKQALEENGDAELPLNNTNH